MAENATESGAATPVPAISPSPPAPSEPASETVGESAIGTSQTQKKAGDGVKKKPPSPFETMLPMILIFVAVFYFVLWRPQSKQRKQRASMLEALKKGDRVVTMGGVLGQIVDMSEHEMTLRVDARKDIQMKFQRSAVLHIATQGAANPPEKAPS